MPPSCVGFVGLCLNGELRDCKVPHEDRCHDEREICPTHMAQVQTCDCTSTKEKSILLKKFFSYMCAHNHFPFLKHLNVAVTNVLGYHFSYSL